MCPADRKNTQLTAAAVVAITLVIGVEWVRRQRWRVRQENLEFRKTVRSLRVDREQADVELAKHITHAMELNDEKGDKIARVALNKRTASESREIAKSNEKMVRNNGHLPRWW